MSSRFLAIDLGAESGRVMAGEFRDGALSLREVCRFANEPVRDGSGWHWDVLRLWLEITRGLQAASAVPPDAIGLDTWGCDFALVGERGELIENPYTYRDGRTFGVAEEIERTIGRDRQYAATGTQLLAFNTLFQLKAACLTSPRLIESAHKLMMMPDLFNFWLTGVARSEYTIASTSQMIDPRTRGWATPLIEELGLPARLLQPLVEPGTILGELRDEACAALAGKTVVAPACHDTGSAFAAVSAGPTGAVLSSGTWSLLGVEVRAPIVTERARELNFTNEGGVCGTTRVLKNIAGMWLLQSCVRAWAAAGQPRTYEDVLVAANDGRYTLRSLIDPDHPDFFNPPDMPAAIAQFCRRTGQPAPDGPAACTRAILESLAYKYRLVLESLKELTGLSVDRIRIVGGGSRNRVLCQLTADITKCEVIAGPVEATALGNIAMQMVATGAVGGLEEARAVIERSFPAERFEPSQPQRWDAGYSRFREYALA